jgi:ferric-dicitrate binding protein FerR (iron transport regulator)
VFWALVVLVLGAAGGAYVFLFGSAPGRAPPPAVEPAPPQEPVRLVLADLAGTVEIERAGQRRKAVAGDELQASDAIVTAPGAAVTLASGGYQVSLDEAARFGVEEITAELSRFRLESGLVSARVADDPGRALEISASKDAVARTTGGDLSVAASGQVVQVAVRRGAARVTSAGQAVEVGAGQQTTAVAGAPPGPPTAIPTSLLLKVAWPSERVTNRRRIVVTGKTEPGAIVVLGEARVDVQPDGRFTHVVLLREGEQRLTARARSAGGLRAEERGPPVVLDTRAPDARFDTGGLWDKDGK